MSKRRGNCLTHVVSAHVDDNLLGKIERAMEKLGLKTRAELVRMALKSFVDKYALASPRYLFLGLAVAVQFMSADWPLFLAAIALVFVASIIYRFTRLVRAESDQETARAQKMIGGCVIGGVLTALARNITQWITGYWYDAAAGVWKDANGNVVDMPEGMASMMDKLLTLLTIIGVCVIIGGIIWGAIQLARRRRRG